MDDEFFDRYTRTLGHDITRREFLRLTAGIVTFAFLSRLPSVRKPSILAGTTQNCYGEDCSEVNDAGLCGPGLIKIEDPSSPPVANGCGAKGGKKFPDQVFAANFKNGCDGHDLCWGSCVITKQSCDETLLNDLLFECTSVFAELNPLTMRICFAAAEAYYLAVNIPGYESWVAAQRESCMCCDLKDYACEGCSHCVSGLCVSGCKADQICCNDQCVDNDQNNCGDCGITCDGCSQCVDGGCISGCGDCEVCGDGGCVSLCDPFTEQCCGGVCWEFACCDDGDGGQMCCPAGCSCCGPGVGGGCQTNCSGSGEPCDATCGD